MLNFIKKIHKSVKRLIICMSFFYFFLLIVSYVEALRPYGSQFFFAILAPPSLFIDHDYHKFNIEKDNITTIKINNPIPLKYVVVLNFVFIDGAIRVYPNILDNDFSDYNNNEFNFQRFIMFAGEEDEKNMNKYSMEDYEYSFSIKGYKLIDNDKRIIFNRDFNIYSKSYGISSGQAYDERNSGYNKGLTEDFILGRGKYIFEIEGKSEKKPFFNSIATYIGIYPTASLK